VSIESVYYFYIGVSGEDFLGLLPQPFPTLV